MNDADPNYENGGIVDSLGPRTMSLALSGDFVSFFKEFKEGDKLKLMTSEGDFMFAYLTKQ
jgi:hypothetical protein